MKKDQSAWVQAVIGSIFGLTVTYTQHHEQMYWALDEHMIGRLVGGMFGGIVFYCLLYRFWPRRKK